MASSRGEWQHPNPCTLSARPECNYCYYMKPVHLKGARIGNSRGVRIPATTLERYHIGTSVGREELSHGILLRPGGHSSPNPSCTHPATAIPPQPHHLPRVS